MKKEIYDIQLLLLFIEFRCIHHTLNTTIWVNSASQNKAIFSEKWTNQDQDNQDFVLDYVVYEKFGFKVKFLNKIFVSE